MAHHTSRIRCQTQDARDARIQGTVELQVVVDVDGTVTRARLVKGLDAVHGLDASALATARRWVFTPASIRGTAVSVVCTIILTFQLT